MGVEWEGADKAGIKVWKIIEDQDFIHKIGVKWIYVEYIKPNILDCKNKSRKEIWLRIFSHMYQTPNNWQTKYLTL